MKKDLIRKKLQELVCKYEKSDVFLVGGLLRDEFSGMEVSLGDIDIVCKDSLDFTSWLKHNYSSEVFGFTKYSRSGAIGFNIMIPGIRRPTWIECSSLVGENLEDDSKSRDFCCNSIYQSLKSLNFYDPTTRGINDAKNKILKTPISPEITFQNDPLRLLRVFRFSGILGFSIDSETRKGIKPYPSYYQLPLERVRKEFSKILLSTQAVSIIRDLQEYGLLHYIIPQLSEGWGFNQNSKYHCQSLSDHLLGVLQFVIDDSRFSSESIRLAALLHDISKYREWKMKEDGSYSYHGHEESSSQMATLILERLGYPEELRKEVAGLIKYHMILKPHGDPYSGSPKTTRKILRKLRESRVDFKMLMALIDGDNHNHSPEYNLPNQVESFINKLPQIKAEVKDKKYPIISGKVIMEAFGVESGKLVGEIKEIMKTYLDDDPSLSENDLINKYRNEFSGKTLWLWKQGISVYASYSEPEKSNWGGYTCRQEVPLKTGLTDLQEGKAIKCEASEYPIIWRNLEEQKKSREIVQEATKILDGLYEIPGFKSISLTLDEYHDLSGIIQKYNGISDYII